MISDYCLQLIFFRGKHKTDNKMDNPESLLPSPQEVDSFLKWATRYKGEGNPFFTSTHQPPAFNDYTQVCFFNVDLFLNYCQTIRNLAIVVETKATHLTQQAWPLQVSGGEEFGFDISISHSSFLLRLFLKDSGR